MKEMLSALVRNIVDEPLAVNVDEIKAGETVLYEIRVAPGDVGRVIGRQGKVIRALRVVMRSVAAREFRRVDVELANQQ